MTMMAIEIHFDKFAAIGEPLSYRDQVVHIFQGLGPDYLLTVQSLSARPDRPSIDEIYNLLINAELNLYQYSPNRRPQKPNQTPHANFSPPNYQKIFHYPKNQNFSAPNYQKPFHFPKNPPQFSLNSLPGILGKPQSHNPSQNTTNVDQTEVT